MDFSFYIFGQQFETHPGMLGADTSMNGMPNVLDYTLGHINASSSILPNISAFPDYSDETTLVKNDSELPNINLLNHL